MKAKIGSGADLFETPVEVEGYTTKDGTFVAPHHSTRKKRLGLPGTLDLFAVHTPSATVLSSPAPEPAPNTVSPVHPNSPPDSREWWDKLTPEQRTDLVRQAGVDPRAANWAWDKMNRDTRVGLRTAATSQTAPPAAAPPPVADAPAAPPAIPERILGRLRNALEGLREIKTAIDTARDGGDAKFDGGGRYESDALENSQGEVAGLRKILDQFRAAAREKGIDPDAVIADLGGEPDLTPSAAAQAYIAGKKPAPQVEPAEAPKAKVPPAPPATEAAERIRREIDQLQVAARVAGGNHSFDPRTSQSTKTRIGADAVAVELAKRQPQIDRLQRKLDRIEGRIKPPSAAEPEKPADLSTAIEWGIPAGTSKSARRKMNADAVALLGEKADDQMTPDDRQVLARYTGTGGIGQSLNEFYTDPAVASAMWSMLANAGFAGGDVLEPSSGTGVFLHTAPAGTRVTAVELDPTSARIAGILHRPAGHEVQNASLERFATQDGRLFDAIVGNVPFGLRGSLIRDDKPDLTTAEAYFVDTSLDKLKDGGLLALIVPTGFMDSRNGRAVRERVLCKGEFLGASRLPNTAFEASHTGVTSDIVMFRKRPQDVAGALGALSQERLQQVGVWDPELLAGTYFTTRGSANVMGRMEEGWRAKAGMGQDITVVGSMQGIPEALAQWRPGPAAPMPTVETILEGADPGERKRIISAALKPPYQVARPGDVRVINGVRYVLQGEPPRWHRAADEIPEAVEDAQTIASMLDDLSEGRARDPQYSRAVLTEALDEYVKEHGVPARNRDLVRWLSAPHLPMHADTHEEDHAAAVKEATRRTARLLGAVNDDGSYSDLVSGRVRDKESATVDTVATKLTAEAGHFTAGDLARAWGNGTTDEVLDHLMASPGYAVEADGKNWTTLDTYLGGDLWAKYDAAREAAAHEGLDPAYRAKYEAQIKALDEAIAPQSLDDVEIRLNSGFVTPELISAWFSAQNEAFKRDNPNRSYSPGTATFSYDDGIYVAQSGKGNNYGLPGSADLVLKFLNRSGVKKEDQGRVERLNNDFREWLLTSEYREAVEESYNRIYRGFRAPSFSDAPIAVPGLNPALDVNAYHFSGLRWALQTGKGIIAADVGLGKTGRGLMLAKLAKVTGQATKPTFVVPKSVMANWLKEAEFWFPGSKVLAIGETYTTAPDGTVTSKVDDAATRRRKFHELQQNDYDFVFISQPTWNDLDVDPITKGEYVNSDFWTKRGDALGRDDNKKLNQIRTAYDQAIAQREFGKREDTLYFGDLGIDMLIMDEGHAYKNLYDAKKRFGESPKFLGGSGKSKRAQDTYFKTKQLRDSNGGKGVFMLTATPTKNSPLEVYSMLSHIAPEAFERMGIKNSEDFLDRFCEFTEDTILEVDGTIEEALVTSGFKNLDELREVMRRYIDRKTAEDVGLALPTADMRVHAVSMTPEQEAEYVVLREQASEAGKGDATGDAHIFSVMSRMGKASLDLELLNPSYKGSVSPKIDACVAEAVKGSADGGQVIFCDSNDVHERIADRLVAAGISRKKIAIINGKAATTSAARQKISDDFNSGKIEFVIGNTATMGEGMNLQKRTADIHHLDLPWEPASMQQRNGRGLRQGNKNKSVRLHTYLAKRSFDGYRYQTIAAKRDWQDLLWNGGDRVENLARKGAISHKDVLIMFSADPDAAQAKYDADLAAATTRLSAERRGKAISMFDRYQRMVKTAATLVAEGGDESNVVQRLTEKSGVLRELLEHDKHFEHKDLLTPGAAPAMIDINSHSVFRVGTGFELAGGNGGPMAYSDEPVKWVVTAVDPDAKGLIARQWGGSKDFIVNMDLSRMKDGVKTFPYDEKAEDAHIAAETEKKLVAMASGGEGSAPKLNELHKLPPDVVGRLAPQIQASIKKAVRNYTHAGWNSNTALPMVGPDGVPTLVDNYQARTAVNDHDFLLPTMEGRKAAIETMVTDKLARTVAAHFSSGRRGRTESSGIEGRYPSSRVGVYGRGADSPWEDVVRHGFGDAAWREGKAEFRRRVVENIKAAPDFSGALHAAGPAYEIQHPPAPHPWHQEVARALRDKARETGDSNFSASRHWDVAVGSKWGSAKPVHGSMFHGGSSYRDTQATVGEWLGRHIVDEPQAEAA